MDHFRCMINSTVLIWQFFQSFLYNENKIMNRNIAGRAVHYRKSKIKAKYFQYSGGPFVYYNVNRNVIFVYWTLSDQYKSKITMWSYNIRNVNANHISILYIQWRRIFFSLLIIDLIICSIIELKNKIQIDHLQFTQDVECVKMSCGIKLFFSSLIQIHTHICTFEIILNK